MTPDITPTEARNAALIAAFNSLDSILSTGLFELSNWSVTNVDEDGLSLDLGRFITCRGDGSVEWESVCFSWDELVAPAPLVEIGNLACTRWDEARAAREQMAREHEARKMAEEKVRKESAAREAKEKKVENDLAILRKLMAAYPSEVKATLFTNLPTTTP